MSGSDRACPIGADYLTYPFCNVERWHRLFAMHDRDRCRLVRDYCFGRTYQKILMYWWCFSNAFLCSIRGSVPPSVSGVGSAI